MYELNIDASFSAAHALEIAGAREPLHGHNWHVKAAIRGHTLDQDGLVCDFHTVHEMMMEIITPFHNNNLNEVAPFNKVNPTAELIAKHIGDELSTSLNEALAPHAYVFSVSVTEAVGCAAIYFPRGFV
jgi:6-pyruvoyltetrahydropterin/6-carboxytetrahydropterin synthase